jgi:hypothetical protein
MKIIVYLLLFELDQIKKMRIIGLNMTNRMQKKMHQRSQVNFEKTTKMWKNLKFFSTNIMISK